MEVIIDEGHEKTGRTRGPSGWECLSHSAALSPLANEAA